MAESDFEVNGVSYKLNKINAMSQFHIARRIAPIIGDLMPIAVKISKMTEAERKDKEIETLAPIFNGLSKLSDSDANRVLIGLLTSVEMKQSTGNWAKVANGEQIMFQNLELPTILNLAGKAFMFNMAGFFAVLPQV